jgi:hypothetical protein
MNIPTKIKILGHIYNITLSVEPQLGSGTSGKCCANLLRIDLDSSTPATRRDEALLHEIIEALKFHLELNLEHSDLSALSEGLYAVMRDNGLNFNE